MSLNKLSFILEHNKDFDKSDFLMSLEILSKMRQNTNIHIPFRNLTKIQFGTYFCQKNG
jgi:hypothetical protein